VHLGKLKAVLPSELLPDKISKDFAHIPSPFVANYVIYLGEISLLEILIHCLGCGKISDSSVNYLGCNLSQTICKTRTPSKYLPQSNIHYNIQLSINWKYISNVSPKKKVRTPR